MYVAFPSRAVKTSAALGYMSALVMLSTYRLHDVKDLRSPTTMLAARSPKFAQILEFCSVDSCHHTSLLLSFSLFI